MLAVGGIVREEEEGEVGSLGLLAGAVFEDW